LKNDSFNPLASLKGETMKAVRVTIQATERGTFRENSTPHTRRKTMKRQMLYPVFTILFAIGFIACGESDNEEVDRFTQPTTQTEPRTFSHSGVAEENPDSVDFAAEAEDIRERIAVQDEALNEQNVNAAMESWVEKPTQDVFMAQSFLGDMSVKKTQKGVKASWEAISLATATPLQVTSTIDRVGIDARGRKATAVGRYQIAGFASPDGEPSVFGGELVVSLRKQNGEWRIQAIDYGNHGLIRELKTP
jgi:ketosteroid isomerase-like protein